MKKGRRRHQVRSLLIPLTIRIAQPIEDPRVQRAVDWIQQQVQQRNAAPAVWDLVVAALNGELGGMPLVSAAEQREQEQLQAVEDLLANFLSE